MRNGVVVRADGDRKRLRAVLLIALGAAVMCGCVRRTIRVTSDPPGALVWLNDREVGRTPVDVDFVHYGTYDVRLVKDGYESMLTTGDAVPPWWDHVGPDLVAEILPGTVESNVHWHYTMERTEPDPDALRAAVVERARTARRELQDETAAVAESAAADEPGGP